MRSANLKFRTVQTPNGPLHTMRSYSEDGTQCFGEYQILSSRPVREYLDPAYPVTKALASNGSAWAMAVNTAGNLVSWKTVKTSNRFGMDQYRMRSVPGGYLGDYVKHYSRVINGKTYSFSRIFWGAGHGGVTLKVYEGQSTKVLKEWYVAGPVSMKKAKKSKKK